MPSVRIAEMTEPTQMVKDIFDSLPDECDITMEHIEIHLDNARSDLEVENKEEAAHEIDMAGRLLICLGSKLRGEKWKS